MQKLRVLDLFADQNVGFDSGFDKCGSRRFRITLPHKAGEHLFPRLEVLRSWLCALRPMLQQHLGSAGCITDNPRDVSILSGLNHDRAFPTADSHDAPELRVGSLVP